MEIFKELNKKGYKHYYDGTIEELDSMDKNNPDLHSEIMQVIMWLFEKHGIWIEVIETDLFNKFFFQIKRKDNTRLKNGDYNSPTEAYLKAIEYTLTTLI
jgi:hypothetical protein